jgi:hypothetical protein
MTPATLTGVLVARDPEGFFTDPAQWTEATTSPARTGSTR